MRAAGGGIYRPTWTMPPGDLDYWDFRYTVSGSGGDIDPAYTGKYLFNGVTSMRVKPNDVEYTTITGYMETTLTEADFNGISFRDVERFEVEYNVFAAGLDFEDPPVGTPYFGFFIMEIYGTDGGGGSARDPEYSYSSTDAVLGTKTGEFELPDANDDHLFIRWRVIEGRDDQYGSASIGPFTITAVMKE